MSDPFMKCVLVRDGKKPNFLGGWVGFLGFIKKTSKKPIF